MAITQTEAVLGIIEAAASILENAVADGLITTVPTELIDKFAEEFFVLRDSVNSTKSSGEPNE